ncbi:LysR substrate-binding domain-containing protein [Acerihabitans sp. TG2]|uniref:LysR substrate-binding domain-containing protein n=1 Tax=Acerihabitans sp. TG2 TaxID=3096008 RepID=UPI002B23A9DF|nr:LysR substrate-binding domain-containing protein [Acerihabitans sp. TG2]MEA9390016.1 LysR substrate-binding domain-containing protein [Acerihabitans sp. TG2]
MHNRTIALDTEALRSFVAGIELGNFALAALRLNRSASAVSAQLKKLEQQCGTALVRKNGRHLCLTDSGEILLSYARRLLAVNDEAVMAVRGSVLAGEVRFGMQEDFGETLLPAILGQFSRDHPNLQITARIDRNQALLAAIDCGQLDLALSWLDTQSMPGARPLAQLPLQWISHPQLAIATYLEKGQPLPLVMFDAPCLMRSQAITTLDAAGISWRVAFVSHSLSGIWAAVSAGLGVTVRSKMGRPTELIANAHPTLPALPTLGITLLQSPSKHSPATMHLQRLLNNAVQAWV